MPTGLDRTLVWGLAAALIVGALVGIEREKSKAVSGNVGIGGVRTFILFALSGALGAWLPQALQSPWVFAPPVAAVAALPVARNH
ncbi:MAG: MgtC/SapB family protein, partial [Betaproteobacteria bacterium]